MMGHWKVTRPMIQGYPVFVFHSCKSYVSLTLLIISFIHIYVSFWCFGSDSSLAILLDTNQIIYPGEPDGGRPPTVDQACLSRLSQGDHLREGVHQVRTIDSCQFKKAVCLGCQQEIASEKESIS